MPKELLTGGPDPSERIKRIFFYAILISIAINVIFGALLPRLQQHEQEQEAHYVTLTKKIKVVVPTPPPPTPPPTPPPQITPTPPPVKQNTPPPEKLKINVPKTKSNSAKTTQTERQYVEPSTGGENGIPQGTGNTSAPISTAPPKPAGTPTPSCAVPNAEAHTVGDPFIPDMPDIARQQGVSGDVHVEVDLDATGKVTGTSIISTPSHVLDQAAMLAARETKYSPKIVNCQKVPSSYEFVVTFSD